jgi:hypothetical protein
MGKPGNGDIGLAFDGNDVDAAAALDHALRYGEGQTAAAGQDTDPPGSRAH